MKKKRNVGNKEVGEFVSKIESLDLDSINLEDLNQLKKDTKKYLKRKFVRDSESLTIRISNFSDSLDEREQELLNSRNSIDEGFGSLHAAYA